MKKFFAFMGIVWQQTLAYRAEHLVWFLLELFPLLIISFFWLYSLRAGRVSSSQFSLLIFYYLANLLLDRLAAVHFDDWVADEIKDGKISIYLLKPFSYQIYLAANELTWRLSGIIFLLPSLILFIPFLSFTTPSSLSPGNIFLVLLLLPVIFLHRFFVSFLIGTSAFWFSQSKAFSHFKWMCEGIFGGSWLPLYFFPLWLQVFSAFTPFYYWHYFPVQLLLGQISGSLVPGFLKALIWLFILWYLGQVVWKRAILDYTAVGS
jgi:ABC-2 type transport system permease protein